MSRAAQSLVSKYKKPLPYLLMGATSVIAGLIGNEAYLAIGSALMAWGVMFVWEAERPSNGR